MKEDFLNRLRNRQLPIEDFRLATNRLSQIMASELAQSIPKNQKIVIAAILRAGLVMVPAFQEKFMHAPIGLIGIQRDETTASPHFYYAKIPPLSPLDHLLVLDPMLATGGTADLALQLLKGRGAKKITLISIISAPEGNQFIRERHPDTALYTVVEDQGLDAQKFIVPGLGDFGDRYFGTLEVNK